LEFFLYQNAYCKEIIAEPHFEVVCKECGWGFVVIDLKKPEPTK